MIPRLLKSNSLQFDTGIPLELTLSCKVVEELNGKYELNMQLLNSDKYASNVSVESIIMAKPNMTSQYQPFVVESITKDIDGVLQIYATHIGQYRSKLIPVAQFDAVDLADAIDKIIDNSLEPNIFNLSTDKVVSTAYSLKEPRSMRDILGGKEGSLLDIYKGEYLFDRLNIELLLRRGKERGFRIMYGSNMTSYTQLDEFSWTNSITGVIPFYKGTNDNNEEVLVVGDVQYSQHADHYTYKKTIPYDVSNKFQEIPSKADVEQLGLDYINSKGLPLINIKASFEDISTLPNYNELYSNIDTLQLGDVVQVINSQYNTNVKTRIRQMDFDVLLERYNSITIGDATTTINEAISGASSSNSYYSYGGNLDIDKIYPVGSIYMSVNGTNPADLFLGTEWERIKDTFLLASGDTYSNGSTGGEASVTLNGAQMPYHYHSIQNQYIKTEANGIFNGDFLNYAVNGSLGGWGVAQASANNRGGSRFLLPAHNTTSSGGNSQGQTEAHNNMPPYLAIYMWKRTA